ncbi:MAG TPA: rubredoxin [Puia sp.]|nr:rubredoxin [Puia sp.]
MFKKNYLVKINLPGGIVAAGDLYAIVEAAERARVEDMQFGARQQLFCKVTDRYGEAFIKELDEAGIFYETEKERYPNIVSSYVSEGVFSRSPWVSEGLYKDILEGFDFRPTLKINLLESGQSFIPFFTGHLNFLSSAVNNHWHLMVRLPGTNRLFHWRTVVYSPDIPRISRLIEAALQGEGSLRGGGGQVADNWGERLYETVTAQATVGHGPEPPPLRLNTGGVPYYEGFNRSGTKNWLGIYRREELFPLDFLKDVCLLALQTKIGQLYTTPWKSLLVKGIEDEDLHRWEYILGKYRINVRHASNELNWQIEDLCPDGLRLKRYLIRQLDQDDVRTEGLTFAIKTQPGSGLAGSIVIRKQEGIRPGQIKLLDRYSIWHTPDFDPHAMEPVLYRKDIEKENLYPYLVSLCKEFYRHQSQWSLPGPDTTAGMGKPSPENLSYQCSDCLTVYDENYGDPDRDIPPRTPFAGLPDHWTCPVCGGEKNNYTLAATEGGFPAASGSSRSGDRI